MLAEDLCTGFNNWKRRLRFQRGNSMFRAQCFCTCVGVSFHISSISQVRWTEDPGGLRLFVRFAAAERTMDSITLYT